MLDEFDAQGATLYGVSCDAVWSQTAFKEKLGVSIEQLSDFEPKGAVCRAFGVYHPGGFPQRALVIVGPDGRVNWSYPGRLPRRSAGGQPDLRRPGRRHRLRQARWRKGWVRLRFPSWAPRITSAAYPMPRW